jgi:hypothetical protein
MGVEPPDPGAIARAGWPRIIADSSPVTPPNPGIHIIISPMIRVPAARRERAGANRNSR